MPAGPATTKSDAGGSRDTTPTPRPRLVDRLDGCVQLFPLTVVSAPAGYGKTVAIEHWAAAHRDGPPVVWLSLLPDDEGRLAATRLVLADLATPGDMILVLDGLDATTDPALHAELRALMAAPPPGVRLLVTQRSRDVPANAAVLDEGDLAFSGEEAGVLVREVSGREVTPAGVDALVARTEGWAVGLKLAAMGLRLVDDPSATIAAFNGSDPRVVAFLTDAVLDAQPAAARRLLTQTSVVDGPLRGELCDAITGDDDGAVRLRELERSGMFLRRLPGTEDWYSCHGLLREVLRRELRLKDPELERVSLVRAAGWYLGRSELAPAARCFVAAEAWDDLVELLDTHGRSLFEEGRARDALQWLDAIPDSDDPGRIDLGIRRAYLMTMLGESPQAAQALHDIETGDVSRAQSAVIGALRATWAFFDARSDAVMRSADAALDSLRGLGRGELPNLLGLTSYGSLTLMAEGSRARALWYVGRVRESRAVLSAIVERADGYFPWLVHSRSALALLEAWAGNLRAAEMHALQASELADRHGILRHPAMLDSRLALAHVATRRGHSDDARQSLDEVGQVMTRTRRPVTGVLHGIERASWHLAAGRLAEAAQATNEHRQSGLTPPPMVDSELLALEVRLALAEGDVPLAESRLASAAEPPLSAALSAASVQSAVAGGDLATAQARLDAWRLDPAVPGHALLHDLWTAVVELEMGHRRQAVLLAASVAARADAEGDVRIFADGGRPAERLVRALAQDEKGESVQRLAHLSAPAPEATVQAVLGLSKRELEVIRYLPTTMSSAEIAAHLYISLNTLKTHLRTIYGKLGVRGRGEAIVRAQELGVA